MWEAKFKNLRGISEEYIMIEIKKISWCEKILKAKESYGPSFTCNRATRLLVKRVIFLLLVQADYSHNYEHHVEELGWNFQ